MNLAMNSSNQFVCKIWTGTASAIVAIPASPDVLLCRHILYFRDTPYCFTYNSNHEEHQQSLMLGAWILPRENTPRTANLLRPATVSVTLLLVRTPNVVVTVRRRYVSPNCDESSGTKWAKCRFPETRRRYDARHQANWAPRSTTSGFINGR